MKLFFFIIFHHCLLHKELSNFVHNVECRPTLDVPTGPQHTHEQGIRHEGNGHYFSCTLMTRCVGVAVSQPDCVDGLAPWPANASTVDIVLSTVSTVEAKSHAITSTPCQRRPPGPLLVEGVVIDPVYNRSSKWRRCSLTRECVIHLSPLDHPTTSGSSPPCLILMALVSIDTVSPLGTVSICLHRRNTECCRNEQTARYHWDSFRESNASGEKLASSSPIREKSWTLVIRADKDLDPRLEEHERPRGNLTLKDVVVGRRQIAESFINKTTKRHFQLSAKPERRKSPTLSRAKTTMRDMRDDPVFEKLSADSLREVRREAVDHEGVVDAWTPGDDPHRKRKLTEMIPSGYSLPEKLSDLGLGSKVERPSSNDRYRHLLSQLRSLDGAGKPRSNNALNRQKKFLSSFYGSYNILQPKWTNWNEWSECSSPCKKGGIRVRRRNCTTVNGMSESKKCQGPTFDLSSCNQGIECEAKWKEWGEWGPCSVTCGDGYQARSRTCTTMDDNYQCQGSASDIKACRIPPCKDNTSPTTAVKPATEAHHQMNTSSSLAIFPPLPPFVVGPKIALKDGMHHHHVRASHHYHLYHYHWSVWGAWSHCPKKCGQGHKTRIKVCLSTKTTPPIRALTRRCGSGVSSQTKSCTVHGNCTALPLAVGAAAAGAGGLAVVNADGDVPPGGDAAPKDEVEEHEEEEEEQEESQLSPETIIFIILVLLALTFFLVAFCIWLVQRSNTVRLKSEINAIHPFYRSDAGDDGPSAGGGIIRQIYQHSNHESFPNKLPSHSISKSLHFDIYAPEKETSATGMLAPTVIEENKETTATLAPIVEEERGELAAIKIAQKLFELLGVTGDAEALVTRLKAVENAKDENMDENKDEMKDEMKDDEKDPASAAKPVGPGARRRLRRSTDATRPTRPSKGNPKGSVRVSKKGARTSEGSALVPAKKGGNKRKARGSKRPRKSEIPSRPFFKSPYQAFTNLSSFFPDAKVGGEWMSKSTDIPYISDTYLNLPTTCDSEEATKISDEASATPFLPSASIEELVSSEKSTSSTSSWRSSSFYKFRGSSTEGSTFTSTPIQQIESFNSVHFGRHVVPLPQSFETDPQEHYCIEANRKRVAIGSNTKDVINSDKMQNKSGATAYSLEEMGALPDCQKSLGSTVHKRGSMDALDNVDNNSTTVSVDFTSENGTEIPQDIYPLFQSFMNSLNARVDDNRGRCHYEKKKKEILQLMADVQRRGLIRSYKINSIEELERITAELTALKSENQSLGLPCDIEIVSDTINATSQISDASTMNKSKSLTPSIKAARTASFPPPHETKPRPERSKGEPATRKCPFDGGKDADQCSSLNGESRESLSPFAAIWKSELERESQHRKAEEPDLLSLDSDVKTPSRGCGKYYTDCDDRKGQYRRQSDKRPPPLSNVEIERKERNIHDTIAGHKEEKGSSLNCVAKGESAIANPVRKTIYKLDAFYQSSKPKPLHTTHNSMEGGNQRTNESRSCGSNKHYSVHSPLAGESEPFTPCTLEEPRKRHKRSYLRRDSEVCGAMVTLSEKSSSSAEGSPFDKKGCSEYPKDSKKYSFKVDEMGTKSPEESAYSAMYDYGHSHTCIAQSALDTTAQTSRSHDSSDFCETEENVADNFEDASEKFSSVKDVFSDPSPTLSESMNDLDYDPSVGWHSLSDLPRSSKTSITVACKPRLDVVSSDESFESSSGTQVTKSEVFAHAIQEELVNGNVSNPFESSLLSTSGELVRQKSEENTEVSEACTRTEFYSQSSKAKDLVCSYKEPFEVIRAEKENRQVLPSSLGDQHELMQQSGKIIRFSDEHPPRVPRINGSTEQPRPLEDASPVAQCANLAVQDSFKAYAFLLESPTRSSEKQCKEAAATNSLCAIGSDALIGSHEYGRRRDDPISWKSVDRHGQKKRTGSDTVRSIPGILSMNQKMGILQKWQKHERKDRELRFDVGTKGQSSRTGDFNHAYASHSLEEPLHDSDTSQSVSSGSSVTAGSIEDERRHCNKESETHSASPQDNRFGDDQPSRTTYRDPSPHREICNAHHEDRSEWRASDIARRTQRFRKFSYEAFKHEDQNSACGLLESSRHVKEDSSPLDVQTMSKNALPRSKRNRDGHEVTLQHAHRINVDAKSHYQLYECRNVSEDTHRPTPARIPSGKCSNPSASPGSQMSHSEWREAFSKDETGARHSAFRKGKNLVNASGSSSSHNTSSWDTSQGEGSHDLSQRCPKMLFGTADAEGVLETREFNQSYESVQREQSGSSYDLEINSGPDVYPAERVTEIESLTSVPSVSCGQICKFDNTVDSKLTCFSQSTPPYVENRARYHSTDDYRSYGDYSNVVTRFYSSLSDSSNDSNFARETTEDRFPNQRVTPQQQSDPEEVVSHDSSYVILQISSDSALEHHTFNDDPDMMDCVGHGPPASL